MAANSLYLPIDFSKTEWSVFVSFCFVFIFFCRYPHHTIFINNNAPLLTSNELLVSVALVRFELKPNAVCIVL